MADNWQHMKPSYRRNKSQLGLKTTQADARHNQIQYLQSLKVAENEKDVKKEVIFHLIRQI